MLIKYSKIIMLKVFLRINNFTKIKFFDNDK